MRCHLLALFPLLLGAAFVSAAEVQVAVSTRFAWFPQAPPLAAPQGAAIRVANVEELLAATQRATPGETILLADGRYALPRHVEIKSDRVTLRGASGRRESVVLDGGPQRLGELVWINRSSGVTIADLTVQNARWNGLKINSDQGATRVTIYNCVIHDIWQRGIKGPAVPKERREQGRPSDCRIQYCLFYNDRPKEFADDPADRPDNFNGNYIGGIDAMYAKGWTISDNLFVGIQGRTREGRGAIFLWHDAQDCLIERNVIVDCDSGICLGNSYRGPETTVHCTRCTVRNNFVVRCPENGIMADYTRDCRILHNTVHEPRSRLGRLVRLVHDNDGMQVAGNLLSGAAIRLESTSAMKIENNLVLDVAPLLRDAACGDLHLRTALPAEGIVPRLAEAPEDFDRRRRGTPTAVGAAEPAGPKAAAPGRPDAADWAGPMRRVHARFRGKPGTLAQYGDSITTSLAFLGPHAWGAKIDPKNCPADVRADLDLVQGRANRRLWTEWKGPQWGNEGSMKSDWLAAHIDQWQKKIQPEVAVVLFGTNDIGQIPARRYAANLETALRRMMADGTVPILTTVPPKSGAEAQAREYRAAAIAVATRLDVPAVDFYGEILRRRPDDWDGRSEKFGHPQDVYGVATLIAADGVHPSNPSQYQNDFSEEALGRNGYNLRNYLTLRMYARVIRQVLTKETGK